MTEGGDLPRNSSASRPRARRVGTRDLDTEIGPDIAAQRRDPDRQAKIAEHAARVAKKKRR